MTDYDADALVSKIIARYGEVINLRESPEVIIDVIRTFRWQLDAGDGGAPPGGAPPAPPPSPGPAAGGALITLEDVMREVLKLSKQLSTVQKSLGG